MIKEYPQLDALDLCELIRTKKVSPRELLDTAIQLSEKLNPKINAISYIHENMRDEKNNLYKSGGLWGIPFLIKDMGTAVKGFPGRMGSKLLGKNVWKFDSEIISRYKSAGLQIFGQTNVPEFGVCVSSESELLGPVRNPYNLSKTAGGSSGGSAAAVSSGIVPVANSSDGGGSIRIPASCCGVFGLKPTRGRNPLGPNRSEGWGGLTVEHVISRSVRDSAALLDVSQGPDTGAYYYAPPPIRSYLEETKISPKKLNIGYFAKMDRNQKLHKECEKALMKTLRLMEDRGHVITEISIDLKIDEMRRYIIDVVACNMVCSLKDIAATNQLSMEQIFSMIEPVTLQFYEHGINKNAVDYIRSINGIHRSVREFSEKTKQYDLLVSPTLAELPRDLGYLSMDCVDFSEYLDRQFNFSPYTALFNYTGQPAASVPIHISEEGLPVGIQIAAGYAKEDLLFQVCASLEDQFIKTAPVL